MGLNLRYEVLFHLKHLLLLTIINLNIFSTFISSHSFNLESLDLVKGLLNSRFVVKNFSIQPRIVRKSESFHKMNSPSFSLTIPQVSCFQVNPPSTLDSLVQLLETQKQTELTQTDLHYCHLVCRYKAIIGIKGHLGKATQTIPAICTVHPILC